MSGIFNSMTYQDISGVCLQRSRRQLLIPPPQRLELQESPYGKGFTQDQLSMRRKVEILKYKNASLQTNSLTKAQQFAALAKGTSQKLSAQLLQNLLAGSAPCPGDDLMPTSTAACGVPGPETVLFLDPAVPLYSYLTGVNATARIPTENDRQYITFIQDSISVSQTAATELFVLYIDNHIMAPLTAFSFSVPFTVTGVSTQNFRIKFVYVYVYYNSTLITSNDAKGTFAVPSGKTPLISTVPAVVTTLSPSSTTSYSGKLQVSDLYIYTSPGFILDIKVVILTSDVGCSILTGASGFTFS